MTATTTTLVEPEPPPVPESFGDGTHIVGTDIAPGRYQLLEPGPGCFWQRLGGFSGEYRDVLAASNSTQRTIVDILGADAAFDSQNCGSWTEYRATEEHLSEFGPGTWGVGGQIPAGTYAAPGGEGCYWAILTSFDGEQTSIESIARPAPGTVTVTIGPAHVGFTSDYCGAFVPTG